MREREAVREGGRDREYCLESDPGEMQQVPSHPAGALPTQWGLPVPARGGGHG